MGMRGGVGIVSTLQLSEGGFLGGGGVSGAGDYVRTPVNQNALGLT